MIVAVAKLNLYTFILLAVINSSFGHLLVIGF